MRSPSHRAPRACARGQSRHPRGPSRGFGMCRPSSVTGTSRRRSMTGPASRSCRRRSASPGRGGTLAYYRNDHGRLARVDLHLAPARYDETSVLPLPDGKGGSTLLVGQSNYESQTPSEAIAVPSVIAIAPSGGGGGGRVTPVVAGDVGSVGPLAVAD